MIDILNKAVNYIKSLFGLQMPDGSGSAVKDPNLVVKKERKV